MAQNLMSRNPYRRVLPSPHHHQDKAVLDAEERPSQKCKKIQGMIVAQMNIINSTNMFRERLMGSSKVTPLSWLRSHWQTFLTISSVMVAIISTSFGIGATRGSDVESYDALVAKVAQNDAIDKTDHARFNEKIATLEATGVAVPEQLRDIQKRLGTVEGKLDILLRTRNVDETAVVRERLVQK